MEIDAKTLYEITFQEFVKCKEECLKYQALYIETKRELDEFKINKEGIE